LFVDENGKQIKFDKFFTKAKSTPMLVCLPSNHKYEVYSADYTPCENTEYSLKFSVLEYTIWESNFNDIDSRPDAFSYPNNPDAILSIDSNCKITWIKK
jgi:hypothetical protein